MDFRQWLVGVGGHQLDAGQPRRLSLRWNSSQKVSAYEEPPVLTNLDAGGVDAESIKAVLYGMPHDNEIQHIHPREGISLVLRFQEGKI
jgi:hypothetical protein